MVLFCTFGPNVYVQGRVIGNCCPIASAFCYKNMIIMGFLLYI